MRRYDEPIEVRRGLVAGLEAPEQFIWRGRLWVVRDVVSHGVETGAWWEQDGVAALLGVGMERASGQPSAPASAPASAGVSAVPLGADLLAESDLWRVEAHRGRVPRLRSFPTKPDPVVDVVDVVDMVDEEDPSALGYGVFDLAFDWAHARWRLVGCVD